MMVEAAMGRIGAHLRRHWCKWLLGSLLFFLAFPGVDLAVSGWFWSQDGGWFLGKEHLLEFVRKGLPSVLVGVLLFMIVLWVAGLVFKERFLGIRGSIVLYLLATLAIGPGLLTNTLFKDNWGRARPSQIEAFGGESVYTPPFMVSDACVDNCSFVSGHGALGFWVTAFAFLVPLPWRGRAMLAALAFGAMVGMVRIIQGGHFFSDVVYAGALTVFVNWALYTWTLGERSKDMALPGVD